MPEFDGDGKYLTHYSIHNLTKTLGTPEDDATNTFTARILLLLESTPILGDEIYGEIIKEVLEIYWRDFEDNATKFIPGFLANDVLRLWRTFCVNYEARTESDTAEKKAKRKVKNYKLKHSRLMTCYSGILVLLWIYSKNGTVTVTDAFNMTMLNPTKRIEMLISNSDGELASDLEILLRRYDRFLAGTNHSEGDLVKIFLDPDLSKEYMSIGYEFGDAMFKCLNAIGAGNLFHRILTV
jgi:hypothetical protein